MSGASNSSVNSNQSPADVAYQLAHRNDNRQAEIYVVSAIMLFLACLAVILRFVSRRMSRTECKSDDWTILLALAILIGFVSIVFWSTTLGLGTHYVLIPNPITFVKTGFTIEIVYNSIVPIIKISILLLYKRIFPSAKLHRALYAIAAFILAYSIIQVFGLIFQRIPVEAIWDLEDVHTTVKYIDIDVLILVVSILNIVTDIVILCVPIRPLWRLKISKQRRIQLIGIFLLGGIVCITSIVRATTLLKFSPADPAWTYVDGIIWSVVELCIGVVSACLPTMRPVLHRILPITKDRSEISDTSVRQSEKSRKSGNTESSKKPILYFFRSSMQDLSSSSTETRSTERRLSEAIQSDEIARMEAGYHGKDSDHVNIRTHRDIIENKPLPDAPTEMQTPDSPPAMLDAPIPTRSPFPTFENVRDIAVARMSHDTPRPTVAELAASQREQEEDEVIHLPLQGTVDERTWNASR